MRTSRRKEENSTRPALSQQEIFATKRQEQRQKSPDENLLPQNGRFGSLGITPARGACHRAAQKAWRGIPTKAARHKMVDPARWTPRQQEVPDTRRRIRRPKKLARFLPIGPYRP